MSSDQQRSYRQILAAVMQRYRLTGTYTVSPWGPDHETKWTCTFKYNEQVIGQSPQCNTKAEAKEAAAWTALTWLAAQGFDVSYALS
ncbi:hypothetical protein FRC14_006332 [Serendipita sp. 396]|nr:hypothetical protein FRC14_006332 [Serendipita sp. 396]KAG8763891.1 hypothetical protein FRC15_007840 [Serendipita sp. 397]KAG8823826.1 hypothetical protein FRC19_003057 [Serendipita sp. 401]KAG8835208.1 hypothetical protein FRC18_000831 [Serendipita sp. 400]KAG8856153.1 hypothetical protein FRB91_001158 [Serendipita sp. 411]KAG9053830.1 hypothetical protein FS842_007014 [Serendipita sp. 407]